MRYKALAAVVLLLFAQGGCSRKNKSNETGAEAQSGGTNTVESNRAQARIYLDKGKEHYRNDEDTQALEAFREAIKLDPELAEAHFRLGLSYDALGQQQEAEEAYKKAVETYKRYFEADENKDDAEAHYNLGQTYAGLHLYSEAVREYRQATRLRSDDAAVYYDLGLALMRLAQYDEAVSAFSKSLELDPENFRAEDELEEAREGVERIRVGKKHQEELLKKKKEEELKKLEDSGATPEVKPTGVKKPL
jgi:tetratricopeptide (TPR) repeat protein